MAATHTGKFARACALSFSRVCASLTVVCSRLPSPPSSSSLQARAHIPEDIVALGHRLRAAAYELGGVHLEGLFAHFDLNNDGELSYTEFRDGVRGLNVNHERMSDEDVAGLFLHFDRDNDGMITVVEFTTLVEELNETYVATLPERDVLTPHKHGLAAAATEAAAAEM